jgi:hypothetical protein
VLPTIDDVKLTKDILDRRRRLWVKSDVLDFGRLNDLREPRR